MMGKNYYQDRTKTIRITKDGYNIIKSYVDANGFKIGKFIELSVLSEIKRMDAAKNKK